MKKEEEWIEVKWSEKLSETFTSDEEYEVVKSSDMQEEKLSEDQKISHLAEFIKSVKWDHLENQWATETIDSNSSEKIWEAVYHNILIIMKMEPGTDEHHKWVQMLKQQITLLNNKQQ